MNSNYKVINFSYSIDLTLINSIIRKSSIKSKNLAKYMSYQSLFSYADYRLLDEEHFLYPRDYSRPKRCIFCHKQEPYVCFEKPAHVIPYLLGNKFLLHYEECDSCNKDFGDTLETALEGFIKQYRIVNGFRNRKNGEFLKYKPLKSQKSLIQFNKNNQLEVTGDNVSEILEEIENNKISLNFEAKYRNSDVYKALMKIIYGLLPEEHRLNFSKLREWIINSNSEVKFVNKLILLQTILPRILMNNLVIEILYKKTDWQNKLDKYNFEYYALIGVGNIFFDIPLLSDLIIDKIYESKSQISLTFETFSSLVIDNYGAVQFEKDMSCTKKEEKYFSLILSGDEKIPR